MKVENIMHRGALWVEADTPVSEIARIMQTRGVGTVVVGRNDRLVGIVTDRDIVCRAVAKGRTWSNALARDVMTRKVIYCHETDDLSDAIRIMRKRRIRRLPVLTRQKRLSGMISLGDVVTGAPKEHVLTLLSSVATRRRSTNGSIPDTGDDELTVSPVRAVTSNPSEYSMRSI